MSEITTRGFGEWNVPTVSETDSARYYELWDRLSADQKSDARVQRASDLYGTETAEAISLLEAVLAPAPAKVTDYVTGSKTALSNPMLALLEYLAAQEHGVRILRGIHTTNQYTWFKEHRISVRTWKALEDRGLIEKPKLGMSTLTAEGYRALFQFGVPEILRQSIVDAAHDEAVEMDAERDRTANMAEADALARAHSERMYAEAYAERQAEDAEFIPSLPVLPGSADDCAECRETPERCRLGCVADYGRCVRCGHEVELKPCTATQVQLRNGESATVQCSLSEHVGDHDFRTLAERTGLEPTTERDVCRKLALANGWKVTEDGLADYGDAWERNGRTLVAVYEVRPDAGQPEGSLVRGCVGTWTRPVEPVTADAIMSAWGDDVIKFRTFAEFAEHVTGKTVADAADALLDDRATDEIPEWGTEPEHAVQAVWSYANTFGAEMELTTLTWGGVIEEAVEAAVHLGWLEETARDLALAKTRTYRVANRVRNLAMLRAAERAKDYGVAVLDSRVLTSDTDGVTRLTIGTRLVHGARCWLLVRERVSRNTLEMIERTTFRHGSQAEARYDLTTRVSSLLGWGWSQAFCRTGDGVTTY